MADDDPYNFEIAIPSAAGGRRAQAASYGRYGASNSDEDDDGAGTGSSSVDVSDLDEDEEEADRFSSHRGDSKAAGAMLKPVARAATGGGGGGSALDKAKSFLSKYSSKPVEAKASAAASSRRSRVELSLDDDDDELSIDSSRDVSRRVGSADERDHDTSSYYEDESPVETKPAETSRPATIAKAESTVRSLRADSDQDDDYNERDNEESNAPPPYSAPPVVAAVFASAYTSANQWKPTPAASTRQDDFDDEEEQSIEAESVASQSDILESQEQSDYRETSQPVASRVTRAEQSAPSESGVYEEEAFEEESAPASPVSRPAAPQPYVEPKQTPPPSLAATVTKTEATFDYSTDFSDDGDAEKQPPASDPAPAATTMQAEPVRASVSDTGDDYESEGERSALLESDSDSCDSPRVNDPEPVGSRAPSAADTAPRSYNAPAIDEAEYPNEHVAPLAGHSKADRLPGTTIESGEVVDTSNERVEAKTTVFSPGSAASDGSESGETPVRAADACGEDRVTDRPPLQQGNRATATSNTPVQSESGRRRLNVVIVRAYETSDAGKPEMKDASTQFTGNHAGIQTELVPDGMHNLQEPLRPGPASYVEQAPSARRETFEPTERPMPSPPLSRPPPAPTCHPTASSLPLSSYSLDMLHQPLATSTSLYKQQLLALQEQILQKKRETERLVNERMSFNYGSLRGTERFIAGRRPPKLQLWEALMRVDPTLDEEKAKEAARLVQGGLHGLTRDVHPPGWPQQ